MYFFYIECLFSCLSCLGTQLHCQIRAMTWAGGTRMQDGLIWWNMVACGNLRIKRQGSTTLGSRKVAASCPANKWSILSITQWQQFLMGFPYWGQQKYLIKSWAEAGNWARIEHHYYPTHSALLTPLIPSSAGPKFWHWPERMAYNVLQ